jgi:predicted Rossmann fold flavoprotein
LGSNPNKNIINVLSIILKYNFVLAILYLLQINISLKASNFTKEHRRKLIRLLKSITLNIADLRSIEEAYVTSGGIDINQINPSTMESKIVEDLFFCGEVLDVDAYTGGFNLQISYSTGYLAGDNQ